MNFVSYQNLKEILNGIAPKVGSGDGTSIADWLSSTTYNVGDIVIHDNLLYKCIVANSDVTFTESNWQLIGGELTNQDLLDIAAAFNPSGTGGGG